MKKLTIRVILLIALSGLKVSAQEDKKSNYININFDTEEIEIWNEEGDKQDVKELHKKYSDKTITMNFSKIHIVINGTVMPIKFKVDNRGQESVSTSLLLQDSLKTAKNKVTLLFEKDEKLGKVMLVSKNLEGNNPEKKIPEFCKLTEGTEDYFVNYDSFISNYESANETLNDKSRIFYKISLNESFTNNPTIYKYKYDKNGKLTTSRAYNISSGKNLSFDVGCYYPLYDSLGISYSYYNYFMDDQDLFTTSMGFDAAQSNEEEESDDASDARDKTELTDDYKSTLTTLDILQQELIGYHEKLCVEIPNSSEVNAVNWGLVKTNIKSCFTDLEGVSAASFKKLIKDRKSGDANIKKAGEIAYLMTLIERTIKQSSVPSLKIKDADEFVLSVDYTKNRKVSATRKYEIPITGGLKIDFSTGLVLSLLSDNEYSHIPNSTVDTIANGDTTRTYREIIQENKGNKLNYGVGVFAHFYPRLGGKVNIAATVGAKVGEELVSQTLLGMSFMLKGKARAVLSAGVALGKVKRLKAKFDTGNNLVDATLLNEVDASDLTTEQRDTNWFFSFTWNFGGNKKEVK